MNFDNTSNRNQILQQANKQIITWSNYEKRIEGKTAAKMSFLSAHKNNAKFSTNFVLSTCMYVQPGTFCCPAFGQSVFNASWMLVP